MKFFWIFLITTSTLVFAQQPNTNIVTSSNGTSTPVKNSVSTQSPPPVVPKPVEKNTSSPKPTQQKQPIKKATVSPKVETPPQESTQSASSDNDGALNSYFQQGSVSATDNSTQESTPEIPSAWGPFFFLTFLVIVVYLIVRWIKKKVQQIKVNNNPVDFIRTLASIPVTGNAQLAIVDIGGKFFLFGITNHSMEMITEITDLDLIMKIQTIPATGNAKSFKEIFFELFGARNSQKISSPKSEEQLKKFIENQKNRIGNMK